MIKALLLTYISIGLSFAGISGARATPALPPCGTQLDVLERAIYTQPGALRAWQAQRAKCRKPWTVVVYLAADNDLTPYAYKNLQEMEAVGSQAGLDIIAQVDDRGTGGMRRYEIFRDPKRDYSPQTLPYYQSQLHLSLSSPAEGIRESVGPQIVKKDRGQELGEFLQSALSRHPSDYTWIVLWGHGRGYAGRVGKNKAARGGLAFDESNGTYFSIPTLKRILGAINRGVLGNRGIDVLSSDACLMQMIEVASDLAPYARYVQGSSQVQNYFGLPYPLILSELASRFKNSSKMLAARGMNPGAFTEDYLLASLIPYLVNHDFKKKLNLATFNFDSIGELAAQTFTSSSFSSAALVNELLPALRGVAAQLASAGQRPDARAALEQLQTEIPATAEGGVDLAMWFGMLEVFAKNFHMEGLHGALAKAQMALTKAVVGFSYGNYYQRPEVGYPYFHSRAVTFWNPTSAQMYGERISEFRSSNFYQWTGWDAWLKPVYAH